MALPLAQKAVNDTVVPSGLVPSLLVFGMIPRFPSVNSELPEQTDRMIALELAQVVMASISAKLRIQKALRARLPPVSQHNIKPSGQVFIYKEKERRWKGPFEVASVDGKNTMVDRHKNGKPWKYNISHLIPEHLVNDTGLVNHVHSAFASMHKSPHT